MIQKNKRSRHSDLNSSIRLQGSLYDYPKYYDLLFSTAWAAELRFLNDCFQRYAGRRVERLFEPACGTGRLLWRLARQGYAISGLDLNPNAVAFCNARLRRHRLPESVFVGDMSDFHLSRKVDAAFNLVSSFCHLTSEEAAAAHLHGMARALVPGGLYILGFHLIPEGRAECDRERWRAVRGKLEVRSDLRTLERDRARRLDQVEFRVDVRTPHRQAELRDRFAMRTYTLPQFESLLRETAVFETLQTYSFRFDVQAPVRLDGKTEDVVYVLRSSKKVR